MGIKIFKHKKTGKRKKYDEDKDKNIIKEMERNKDYKELMIL